MRRWLTALLVVAAVTFGVSAASAQETTGASRLEVTGFPGGAIYFTEGGSNTGEPDFGTYSFGGSVTYNLNRSWGIEGELGVGLGINQRLNFNDGRPSIGDVSPPDQIGYSGNVLFYPFKNDHKFVPYVTGGIGGLTMFDKDEVGFGDDETFFTGNTGGGVKWYFGRWGVRGDYRFMAIKSKDDAPAFFANADTRYAHRVFGGLVFGFGGGL